MSVIRVETRRKRDPIIHHSMAEQTIKWNIGRRSTDEGQPVEQINELYGVRDFREQIQNVSFSKFLGV